MNILVLVASLKKEDGQIVSPVLDEIARYGNATVIETNAYSDPVPLRPASESRGNKDSGVRFKSLPRKSEGFYMHPAPASGENEMLAKYVETIRQSDGVIAILTYDSSELGFLVARSLAESKPVLALVEGFTFSTRKRFDLFRGIRGIQVAEFTSQNQGALAMILHGFTAHVGATRAG